MYKTPYNVANNQSEIYEFMIQNTFVSLIGFDGNFPVATQIPVETIILGDSIKIIGHMMTKTDHCRAFEKNQNVLVLYTSAHAYISASVYEIQGRHLHGIIKAFRQKEGFPPLRISFFQL